MRTDRPLSTLIFDLGGVLVLTHWDRVTSPLARLSGRTPEAVMELIVKGDAYYPFMRGEIQPDEFHRRMCEGLGFNLDFQSFAETWASIIAPNPGLAGLVERLRGGYRLALGSNTDVIHHARGLEVQKALRHFREGLLSFELGCCKPDPAFFTSGLARLGVAPAECLFIDDRPENVASARSVGITAVQFHSARQLEQDLERMGIV